MAINNDIILAQKSIINASRNLSEAGMRLRYTKYQKEYDRLWNSLRRLNDKLIKEINK